MSGVMQGGWEYVYAAYATTGLTLVAYATSLWLRLRREP
jgi:hypothetical protein